MADTHELQEDQIVREGQEISEVTEADEPSEAPARKLRAKRPSVKAVETRVAAIEERVEALGPEIAQFGRLTEQLAQLSQQLVRLNERLSRLEQAPRPSAGDGHVQDGGGLAEHVRQLDDRLQKLANILTQQTWGIPRV